MLVFKAILTPQTPGRGAAVRQRACPSLAAPSTNQPPCSSQTKVWGRLSPPDSLPSVSLRSLTAGSNSDPTVVLLNSTLCCSPPTLIFGIRGVTPPPPTAASHSPYVMTAHTVRLPCYSDRICRRPSSPPLHYQFPASSMSL